MSTPSSSSFLPHPPFGGWPARLQRALEAAVAQLDIHAAPPGDVVERAFQSTLDHLALAQLLKTQWSTFALRAAAQGEAVEPGLALSPAQDVSTVSTEPGVVLRLLPAPVVTVCARRELARAVPAVPETLVDDAVPPGAMRVLLYGTAELAYSDSDAASESEHTAHMPVALAMLDLEAPAPVPPTSRGTARTLTPVWPWLESLAAQVGIVWAGPSPASEASEASEAPVPTPRRPYGPTERTRELAETIRQLKEQHPTWSQARVAMELDVPVETIRNAYRLMGWKWQRADRVRRER